jgi:hypothetical protein
MDNFFRQQGSKTQQQPGGLLVSLQILDDILQWLIGLIQLTEEEQDDAGIYFGHPGCE